MSEDQCQHFGLADDCQLIGRRTILFKYSTKSHNIMYDIFQDPLMRTIAAVNREQEATEVSILEIGSVIFL